MNSQTILTLMLGILVISQLLDWWLGWLNLRSHRPEVPTELAEQVDADAYARSHAYHRVNHRFGLLRSGISFLTMLPIIALGGLGWWDAVLRTVTEHQIWLPLLYFGSLFLISDLLSLPFSWYKTFHIEERFGFNKMTPKTFWLDKLKGYLLTFVVGGLILGFLLWLIQTLGQDFWWWFWLFMGTFILVMNLFYTDWILPLFNKLAPLESGELREKIERYAAGVAYPLTNIYVIDGSRRSTKANAFFSGLGKRKKVVLYDTLIEQHSDEELVAVLAHEIGHYKKRHIYQSLVLSLLQTGLLLFILSRFLFSPALSQALGGSELAIHLNLIAFGLLYSPISLLLSIGMNMMSRHNEFEADRYAAETYASQPLQTALLRLHTKNLSNATPHPWYVFMNYSHPPLIKRLRALRQLG